MNHENEKRNTEKIKEHESKINEFLKGRSRY